MWKEASKLIKKAGETRELLFLKQASDILFGVIKQRIRSNESTIKNQLTIEDCSSIRNNQTQ